MSDDLPEGWVEAKIGDVLYLVNGFAFKPSHWMKSGLPIIRIQNLNNPNACFNYFDGTLPEKVRIKRGDLLFAWSGTPGTSFGTHIWKGGDAWLNQHIFRVEFDNRLFNKFFLRHAINQNLDQYIAQAHGCAGLAHITKGMFEASTLRVAPLAEQCRIVAKLEELLGKVDACQKRLAKVPVLLKRFRQSVLAAACSGRLTEDWRDKVTDQEKQVIRQVNPELNVKIERIVDTPDYWRWRTLQALCDPVRSICYGVIKLGIEYPNGIPCLRTSDVKPLCIDTINVKRISPSISNKYSRTILCGNEILVNVRGTLGGVAVVPPSLKGWNISREVALVPIDGVLPMYVAFWIASSFCQNWLTKVVKGVAYSGINIEDLRILPIALPSTTEQKEIVRRVEELLALANRIEERYKKAKVQVDKLTQSILAKAFRGELVPQDPNDEPASVLLERIRAEG